MKYLFIFSLIVLFTEFEEFCLIYMQWVHQYPGSFSAGCCEINHPSNDILKEEYLGESMLFCNGQYIYE